MSGAISRVLSEKGAVSGIRPQEPESYLMGLISRIRTTGYLPCSSKNLSTSMAAMHPVPAAVMAWR